MRNGLFRDDVIQREKQSPLSSPLTSLKRPREIGIYSCILLFGLTVTLCIFGKYPKVEKVKGVLNPHKGVIRIYSSMAGTIQDIYVTEGASVKRGTAMFSVRNDKYSSSDIEISHSSLEKIEDSITRQTLRLQNLESLKTKERNQLELESRTARTQIIKIDEKIKNLEDRLRIRLDKNIKLSKLRKKGSVSDQEFIDDNEMLNAVKENLIDAQSSRLNLMDRKSTLAYSLSNIDSKYIDINSEITNTLNSFEKQKSELSLGNFQTFYSPVNGDVSSLQAYVGQSTDSNKMLLTIVPENSRLEAQLLIPSRSMGKIKIGQKINLKYDAFPYELYGSSEARVESFSMTVIAPREVNDGDISMPTEPSYRLIASLKSINIKDKIR